MEFLNYIAEFLSRPLFELNGKDFTLLKIIIFIGSLVFIFIVSSKIRFLITAKLLRGRKMSEASKHTIGILSRYFVLVFGLIVLLNQVGIDLDSITVILGALGVGIGFGLQNIINNIVSGMIILFERPIQVGDRVEVNEIEGNVVEVSLRSTVVKTNDNVNIIVPNSEFISKNVINWSHGDSKVRRRIQVGVSYQEDPEEIRKLLLEVAEETDAVLKKPEPDVIFKQFGDSSLDFELRVWTMTLASKPGVLNSDINFRIAKKFRENNIEIPYPQRDLHIKEKN